MPSSLRLTSISRGQFRAWLKNRLLNQAYTTSSENIFILRVNCTYILTVEGAGPKIE